MMRFPKIVQCLLRIVSRDCTGFTFQYLIPLCNCFFSGISTYSSNGQCLGLYTEVFPLKFLKELVSFDDLLPMSFT